MFPIGDENQNRRLSPVVNYGLIAVNIVIFLYELILSAKQLNALFFDWGAVPAEIWHGHRLYTLVTSQFLHNGWLHIGGNMLFLWVFGDNVEDTLGHIKYLCFYLACGILAGLAQVATNTQSHDPLIGASGAIAAVLGAYIVLFPRGNVRTLVWIGIFATIIFVPAWLMIGLWIVLQFFNGIATIGLNATDSGGGVAYFAHLGGFVAGAVLVWVFRDRAAHHRQLAARRDTHAFKRTPLGR